MRLPRSLEILLISQKIKGLNDSEALVRAYLSNLQEKLRHIGDSPSGAPRMSTILAADAIEKKRPDLDLEFAPHMGAVAAVVAVSAVVGAAASVVSAATALNLLRTRQPPPTK
jgi:hypothetical protein